MTKLKHLCDKNINNFNRKLIRKNNFYHNLDIMYRKNNYLIFLLLLISILLALIPYTDGVRTIGNECDWTGSGLKATSKNREITPIYLRCTAGKIIWRYPRGAIRVLLRQPMKREFKSCIKIHPVIQKKQQTTVSLHSRHHHYHNKQLHHENITKKSTENENKRFPARIFLEKPGRLIPLYPMSGETDDSKTVFCFRSTNNQVALYVEADNSDRPFENFLAEFEYDLEYINNKYFYDSMINNFDINNVNNDNKTIKNQQNKRNYIEDEILSEFGESWNDCKPCSEYEMSNAYCASDIVVRGTISDIQQRYDIKTSEIIVKNPKILRCNDWTEFNINFLNDNDNDGDNDYLKQYKYNKVITNKNNNNNGKEMKLSFHWPQHCLISHGDGEFVFMGRRRFNEIALMCAPRLSEWFYVTEKLNSNGQAACNLRS